MTKVLQQYTIRKLRNPTEKMVDKDVEWVCNSLGFVTSRDHDKTAYRIMRALINAAKKGTGMTSEELTRAVSPTVGSVIYHLNRLMKAGLAVKLDSKYELRMRSLLATIEEIQKEANMVIDNIKAVARDIDDNVGLENR
ncbi:MAG: hypothetical protein ABH879_01780 [archaeon]